MKFAHLLPILVLIASGFTTPGNPVTITPTEPMVPVSETAVPRMRTSTPSIYKGEEIRLDFLAPNPAYLGVIDPEGKFFYVVYPTENGFGGLRPFVSSEDFRYMWQMTINTPKFSADPYIYGVNENQPVFTKSGNYTFILGDNLHVDDASQLTKVTVSYTHKLRSEATAIP